MRPNNQNGKRSRGRGRRPSGFNQPNVNRNTTFESNGPEGKLRGNAQQLYEKYTALAQDANSSSERISAEAFSQFADHYYRVHQTILASIEQKRNSHDNKSDDKQKPIDVDKSIVNNNESNKGLNEKDTNNLELEKEEKSEADVNVEQGSDEISTAVLDKASNSKSNADVRPKSDDAVA